MCHNHQKTTTDDLAHANVWHFYLCTLCSVTLFFLICLWHIIPHLPPIISLPSHFSCFVLEFLNADRTCELQSLRSKKPHIASPLGWELIFTVQCLVFFKTIFLWQLNCSQECNGLVISTETLICKCPLTLIC